MDARVTVTDSEWKIMELLWANGGMTMPQLTHALERQTGWSKHTVISLLKRMCEKGSALVEPDTSPKVYRARIDRQAAVRQETNQLLRKVFGGRGALMVSQLVDQEPLSDEEIDELMRLLESKRGDGK